MSIIFIRKTIIDLHKHKPAILLHIMYNNYNEQINIWLLFLSS